MSLEAGSLLDAVMIGAGATLILDLWTLLLKHAFKVPSFSYCLVGRWLGYIIEGTFTHASIAAAAPKPAECSIGWLAHYALGVLFALVFLALAPPGWLVRPTLLPALLFGVGTVLVPYLVMQPAFGLGVAASKTPNPTAARLKSLVSHGVFGLGLYVCAMAARACCS
jgi:Protein of unknown function (DUF2938)